MPTTNYPEPTLERLRFVSTAGQFFGRDRLARVLTYDGGVYVGRGLSVFYDELMIGAPFRPDTIHLPLAIVARIERYELRLGRAVLLGLLVAILGGVIGAAWDRRVGDPLHYHERLLLGSVLGSMAAPFVVWFAQAAPGLRQWRVFLDEQAV